MVDFHKALADVRARRATPEYRCMADVIAAYRDGESEAGIVSVAKRHLDEATAAKDARIVELEGALRPFANMADNADSVQANMASVGAELDDTLAWLAEQCRAARKALGEG